MASQAPSTKPTTKYVGRSPLTGLLIMKPAPKAEKASVTIPQVRRVIKQLRAKKK